MRGIPIFAQLLIVGKMEFARVVAAADESTLGRHAVRMALNIARRTSGGVSIMTARPTRPSQSGGANPKVDIRELEQWLKPELAGTGGGIPVDLAVSYGLPGIEISHFAERRRADLIVLGRRLRSRAERLILGDTADAVARRSRIPSLFVPITQDKLERILVALDGSERGLQVLDTARELAEAVDASLRIVTVEPADHAASGDHSTHPPLARTDRLRAAVARPGGRAAPAREAEFVVRHGDTVMEIINEVSRYNADVLVVGYHTGGPAGVIEGASVSRRLVHLAPCAVLTVPL